MKLPVLLVIFKRPDLTARVMEVLRRVRPPRLYIAADAPRPGRNEEGLCAEARAIAEAVDWPCEVTKNYNTANVGSGRRVSSAITWFFETETEGVIVEDDCLPDDTFFRFCEELLEKYRDVDKVKLISGYRGSVPTPPGADSYSFSKYCNTWGWATWRRAWRFYDLELVSRPDWETFKQSELFRSYCDRQVEREFWVSATERSLREYRAWDAQWTITTWMQRGVGIIPAHNLIQNAGFRPDAAHTTDDLLGRHRVEASPMQWPLKHPAALERDAWLERQLWQKSYRPVNFFEKVWRKVLRARQILTK